MGKVNSDRSIPAAKYSRTQNMAACDRLPKKVRLINSGYTAIVKNKLGVAA